MKSLQVSLLKESCRALVLCLIATSAAHAGTQPDAWWSGDWNCDIGGRPARMSWSVVEGAQPPAGSGDAAAMTTHWQGSLSSGSDAQPVALSEPSQGKKGGLYFRHADGHQWYLQKPVDNKAAGWTSTAALRNAPRAPISCWR